MTHAQGSAHRPDVDWLRAFAIYLLFPFHVAMIFNPAPFYHVRNDELSFAMLVFCGFIGLWHMPLLFFLAGWSAFRSLRNRDTGRFLGERVRKLLIPLVAGCVLLCPIIKYFELKSGLDANVTGLYASAELQQGFRTVIPEGLRIAPPFDQGFFEFLPTFFTRIKRFTWAHLWFLAYLLTFTTIYLPLFHRLRRARVRLASRAWIYLPILPLAAIQIFLRPHWPGLQNLYDDWANFAYYSTYLLCGYVLATQPALEDALEREWKRAFALGGLTTLVLLAGLVGAFDSPHVLLAGSAVAGWCFVVGLIGFGRARLAFSNRALPYLRESSFPVYILHQLPIVVIGYAVVALPIGMAAKFAVILVSSVLVTLVVYHLLVRRFALLRFLFGMKPKPASPRKLSAAWSAAGSIALVAACTLASRPAAASPLGLWWAEGGAAKVEIVQCGEALCGRVVWLRSPFDENGCRLRDENNPDARLRGRPVEGLAVLDGLRRERADEAVWGGGTIYDPTSGRTYAARLRLDDDDRLLVRGYLVVPLLGRTTTWIRVGAEERACGR
jgi:glucan biosynthesis protein C